MCPYWTPNWAIVEKDQTTDEHQCDKCLDAIILDISIVLFNPS